MGLLHGLGGGGALALIVLATLPSPAAAFLYILVFGAGSTAGMLAFSGLLGIPFALAGGSPALGPALRVLVGASSLVVGLLLMRG